MKYFRHIAPLFAALSSSVLTATCLFSADQVRDKWNPSILSATDAVSLLRQSYKKWHVGKIRAMEHLDAIVYYVIDPTKPHRDFIDPDVLPGSVGSDNLAIVFQPINRPEATSYFFIQDDASPKLPSSSVCRILTLIPWPNHSLGVVLQVNRPANKEVEQNKTTGQRGGTLPEYQLWVWEPRLRTATFGFQLPDTATQREAILGLATALSLTAADITWKKTPSGSIRIFANDRAGGITVACSVNSELDFIRFANGDLVAVEHERTPEQMSYFRKVFAINWKSNTVVWTQPVTSLHAAPGIEFYARFPHGMLSVGQRFPLILEAYGETSSTPQVMWFECANGRRVFGVASPEYYGWLYSHAVANADATRIASISRNPVYDKVVKVDEADAGDIVISTAIQNATQSTCVNRRREEAAWQIAGFQSDGALLIQSHNLVFRLVAPYTDSPSQIFTLLEE